MLQWFWRLSKWSRRSLPWLSYIITVDSGRQHWRRNTGPVGVRFSRTSESVTCTKTFSMITLLCSQPGSHLPRIFNLCLETKNYVDKIKAHTALYEMWCLRRALGIHRCSKEGPITTSPRNSSGNGEIMHLLYEKDYHTIRKGTGQSRNQLFPCR